MKNETLQQEVKTLVSNYLENKGISQNQLANMIGVSSATISSIINENWERINDSMLLKIKAFFRSKSGWTIIKTSNFNAIQDACTKARAMRMMVGIIGFSGAGKTTALNHYYESEQNTYKIVCARTMRSKQFLAEILRSMGVNYTASDYLMTRRIIDELNRKESPLLIIDEASKLSQNALMYIQDIWDGIEHNGSIVLAGVDYLFTNIKKWSDKGKVGMPEFYGRVFLWLELRKPTKKEIKSICEHNGLTDPEKIKEACFSQDFRKVRNIILS